MTQSSPESFGESGGALWRREVWGWIRREWDLFWLLVGFALSLILILGSMIDLASVRAWFVDSPLDPFNAYDRAVSGAALKQPHDDFKLSTLDPTQPKVVLVTFRSDLRTIEPKDRSYEIWAAKADELGRLACTGSGDPVRRLQQALGLPPLQPSHPVVTEILVDRDKVIRPCIAGGDTSAASCTFDLPPELPKDAKEGDVRAAYDRLYFGTKQMWSSYRRGFLHGDRKPGEYPYTGFPFTGMGWSYDWSPDSRTHVGVTEFVIPKTVAVEVKDPGKNPADFCAPYRGK
jgi:hypothetical protein